MMSKNQIIFEFIACFFVKKNQFKKRNRLTFMVIVQKIEQNLLKMPSPVAHMQKNEGGAYTLRLRFGDLYKILHKNRFMGDGQSDE